jgi:hypothetical protein
LLLGLDEFYKDLDNQKVTYFWGTLLYSGS